MKLEINGKRNYRKYTNTWRLNNTLLNNQWVFEKSKKLEDDKNQMKMETQLTRIHVIQ
jgi:hypothetical protein